MGRKSSIVKLDPQIREAVDGAVREGRATIEEIVLLIRSMGGEASKSAVGRYVKSASEQLASYRKMQEVAKVWIGKINDEPDGDVGRLAGETLKMLAVQVGQSMSQAEIEEVKPMDLMLLGKTLDHVAKAGKADLDKVLKIRKEFAQEAAAAAAKTATAKGLSAETVDEIKKTILGIV